MKKILTNLLLLGAGVFALFCVGVAPAQNVQTLYNTPATPTWRDNYTGASGCQFTIGVSNVVVSHLGYFCSNAVSLASVQSTAGLLNNHYVALFASSGTPPPIIAEVTVPAGAGADWYTNQFVWMPLDPPVLLLSNVTYYVAAMPTNGDGDLWGDSFSATFNGFFVGATTNTLQAPTTVYGPGGQWPPAGFSFGFTTDTTYCVESMANLPVDKARCSVQFTNLNVAPGNTISVLGFASGQPPINYQWYYNGAPLGGQTDPVLTIPNANAAANNGTYYLTATNSLGGEQSAIVNVLVSDEPVGTVLGLTNMTVFANYPANFSLVVTGTPPISIQWFSNNVVIPSAATNEAVSTNFPDTYSFYPSYPANNGNVYTAIASNNISPTAYTATNTSTLTVLANVTYPQQQLIPSLPNSLFTGNGGGGSENAAGALITANQSVLVTHMGYPATGLILENQAALAANHNLSIYLWNNGSPQILSWAQVTNGTPTNSEINGYFWAPLNAPVQLTSGTKYLISAQTYSAVDDWGGDYGVTNLNPYFSSSIAAYYVNNITWPTAPTLGGYGAQMYSCINMASLTNFAAAYVSNSAPSAADNYLSYSTNVLIPGGNTLNMVGFGEGQPPLYYPRWYLNGTLLAGQTNMNLTIPSVSTGNVGNYYLVLSNYQTSVTVTSEVTAVTLVTYPLVLSQLPVTYTNIFNAGGQIATNLMFIYSNANPTFSVSAAGATSTSTNYQWYSNNVAVSYATNSSFTLTNAQPPSLNVYCIITNTYGSATSLVWTATVLPAPTNSAGGLALYPQATMALNPIAYWRMNDANLDGQDNINGDNGYICHDYISGNDGIYTNAYYLGSDSPSYNPVADPSDSSATFSGLNSDVNSILAPNMGTPNGVNAEFTVEAWADPLANMAGENTPTIVAKGGYFQEEFTIDCGNTSSNCFRFEVRSANGTAYNANSTVPVDTGADENTWFHLVGVCDEANGLVSLYINGQLAATTAIPAASGITNTATTPITIGSRSSTDSQINNNEPFVGAINDVAMFNYPLGSNQIALQYAVSGNVVPFLNPAPATVAQLSVNGTLGLAATAYGTGPLNYTWTDLSTSTVLASGSTNGYILNASYTNNDITGSWNNQTLQLIVTNAYGAVTDYVAILVYTNPPVFTANLPATVTVAQGQDYIYTASFNGGTPLGYLWYSNGIALPASAQTGILSPVATGTYSPFTATASTNTYQIVVTNYAGATTSIVSTLIVAPPPSYPMASAILALHPIGYWPLHEVEPGVAGDIETNYGTLGHQADAYYPDYGNLASSEFQHDWTTPSPVCGDANSMFFTLPSGTSSGSPIDGVDVNRANPGTALVPPFSVECWFWPSNSAVGHGFGNIWSQDSLEGLNAGTEGGGGGNSGGVMLNYQNNGSGQVYVDTTDGGGSQNYLVSSLALPGQQWNYAVITCDASTNFSLYTNGVQCGTAVSGVGKFIPDTWTPFCVGNGRGWTRPVSQMAVADVAIYTNIALPAGTVANHYSIGINTPANYFSTVMSLNPPVFLRMDSPPYVATANSLCPVVQNFGSIQPASYAPGAACAFYTPGTWPGIAPGPNTGGVSWTGNSGNVAPMSGVSSWADVGYNPAYDFGGSNACSMMVTFRGNPADDRYQTVCGMGDQSWKFDMNVNGGGYLAFAADGTGAYPLNSSTVCNDGNWHQAVAVYQPSSIGDGSIYLYIDGQLNAVAYNNSSNGIQPGNNVNSLLLGAVAGYTNNSPGFGRQFNGQLCDVAIFTNALTPGQVLGLYKASGEPATAAPAITSVLPVPAGSAAQATNTLTLYAGVSPSYMVTANSSPTSYQWYTNGVFVNGAWQGTAVAGGTNATLTLPNVPAGWITNYCVVANALGAVTSVVWEAQVIADPDLAGSFSQDVIADNPVAYWRMNESHGSAYALDYAGGANAAYGQQTTNGLPGVPLAGDASQLGVSMDSTASHNLWGTLTNNGIILTTNTMTIICWIKPYVATQPGYAGLFVNRSTAGDSELSFSSTGAQTGYSWGSTGASTYSFASGAAVVNNEWNMVVGVYTPNYFAETVYNASGQVVNTGPSGGSGSVTTMNGYGVNILTVPDVSFTGYNFIGCDPNGTATSRIFNGEMNEMAIFNYALSPAQVAQLAATAITTSPAPQLTSVQSGTNLVLSWTGPSPNPNGYNYTGWQLQAQTNKVTVGISTNWANYNPSLNVNQVIIPVNLTNGTVFYRLIYNP